MSNRPRRDRDDDITDLGRHKFDGSGKFDGAEKFDGPWKNDGAEEFYGADSLKADGGDVGLKFDGLKFDGAGKLDGSDRDGPWKADGGDEYIDKADGSDEYWIDDEGVVHVAAVETAMPERPTIDVPELDLGEPAFADSFLDAPVTDFESASSDHGGDELLDS